MKIYSKVMIVTGGGNGLGQQIVLQLLKKGAYVAAVDINQTGLEKTRGLSRNNGNLSIHEVD